MAKHEATLFANMSPEIREKLRKELELTPHRKSEILRPATNEIEING